jgi:hypothetical protein
VLEEDVEELGFVTVKVFHTSSPKADEREKRNKTMVQRVAVMISLNECIGFRKRLKLYIEVKSRKEIPQRKVLHRG